MADGTTEKMTGDDEAAAAIAGMIETYGATVAEGACMYTVFVSDRIETGKGVTHWVSEYPCLGRLPGNVAVLRHKFGGPPFLRQMDVLTYETREAALVDVRDQLTAIRDAITRQIESVTAEVRSLSTNEGG